MSNTNTKNAYVEEETLRPSNSGKSAEEYKGTTTEPYKCKTVQEIKEIALGIYKGQIFTSNQVKDLSVLGLIFMALSMSDENYKNWMKENDIYIIYEYIDKCLPTRSINDYPIFTSHSHLNKEDAIKVEEKFNEIKKVLDLV